MFRLGICAAVGAGASATKHAPFLCYSPTRAKRGQVDLFPRYVGGHTGMAKMDPTQFHKTWGPPFRPSLYAHCLPIR